MNFLDFHLQNSLDDNQQINKINVFLKWSNLLKMNRPIWFNAKENRYIENENKAYSGKREQECSFIIRAADKVIYYLDKDGLLEAEMLNFNIITLFIIKNIKSFLSLLLSVKKQKVTNFNHEKIIEQKFETGIGG